MKVLLALSLLIACALAEDWAKKAKDAIRTCVDEVGFDKIKMIDLAKQSALPVDDDEFLKFFNCYYQKIGLMDSNGELVIEKVREAFPHLVKEKYENVDAEKLANEAIDHCKDEIKTGSSAAASAIKLRNCSLKYVEEHH